MDAWYALHTKPHSELRVHRTLVERGFNAYLPLLAPRKDAHAQPLFPAYLFVYCDLDVIELSDLQWIPGLRRILSFEGRPAVVPEDAIYLIRTKTDEINAQGGLPMHTFKAGDEVVIEQGPLRGLRGIFQGPMKPSERVQILISFLGEANRAEIPVEALRAVSEEESERFRRRTTRGRGRRVRYREQTDPTDDHSSERAKPHDTR
jgi:transcription antitermination factor NusG